jgi:hypothetical protein
VPQCVADFYAALCAQTNVGLQWQMVGSTNSYCTSAAAVGPFTCPTNETIVPLGVYLFGGINGYCPGFSIWAPGCDDIGGTNENGFAHWYLTPVTTCMTSIEIFLTYGYWPAVNNPAGSGAGNFCGFQIIVEFNTLLGVFISVTYWDICAAGSIPTSINLTSTNFIGPAQIVGIQLCLLPAQSCTGLASERASMADLESPSTANKPTPLPIPRTEEEQAPLRAICLPCDKFDGEGCRTCGCMSSRKPSWESLLRVGDCPLGKWPPWSG